MSDISTSSNIISIIISIHHNYGLIILNGITNKSRTQNIPVFLFDRIDGSTLMVRTIWLRFAAKFIISSFWVPITNSRRIFSHKIWRIYNISQPQEYFDKCIVCKSPDRSITLIWALVDIYTCFIRIGVTQNGCKGWSTLRAIFIIIARRVITVFIWRRNIIIWRF